MSADDIFQKANVAAAVFSQYSQEQVDAIVRAVYKAGFDNRVRLAKMAVEETKLGRWQDKVIKNVLATQIVYEDIKDDKTVGIISDDKITGILEIAQPIGPILAITPVTNPTSTAMFKIIIALKTRNPIIISPHRNAEKCTMEAARVCYEAALSADAPEDCIQWVTHTSREETQKLMSHKSLALILATGGSGLVRAAYSSGTPAIGVGSGNVPVLIEKSADAQFAVSQILASKTFDNGTVCCSEQAIVAEQAIAGDVIAEFSRHKAYFLEDGEIPKLERVAFDREKGIMNAAIIGKPAGEILKLAGLNAPPDTSVIIARLKGVGANHPLSSEILAPILAFYTAPSFDDAVNLCIEINFHGGMGHTASMYSNDEEKIRKFANLMNAGRILINTPSSQGGVGGFYNTLSPSLTLGCGTGGKNITTDNITARHLLNIQRIARRRVNDTFASFDHAKYYDESFNAERLEKEYCRNR
ncbi:MAG: aldehyde dehydrogenase family protein [Elusimicrobiales bacterium]